MLAALTFFATPGIASASHFRSGNVNWEEAGPATDGGTPVRFNVVLSYRWSNFGQPAVGHEQTYESVNFGDGSSASPTFRVTFVNQAEDYFIAEAIEAPGSSTRGFLHTYAEPGPFTATITGCCIISPVSSTNPNGLNNAGDSSFGVQSLVDLAAEDESPKTSLPPVVNLPEGGVQRFSVPATDAGGERLRFRLTTAAESCGNCSDPHPPGLTIDQNTGQISWDTTGREGLWYSGVVVEALNASGSVVSTTQVVYILRVGGEGNQAPVWQTPPTPADGSEFTLVPGQQCTIDLRASDPDAGNIVTIFKNTGPGALTAQSGNPALGTYRFTPTSADVGTTQIVQFIAQDNGVPPSGPPPRSYTLRVVAGPAGPGCASTSSPPTPTPTLTLTPDNASRTTGESHTVLAHAENGAGTVYFFVRGAHSVTGTTPTNAAGDALFSYPSDTVGGDTISAFLDLNGNGAQDTGEPQDYVTAVWNLPPQEPPSDPQEPQLPDDIPVADSIDELPNPQPYRNTNVQPTGRGNVYVMLPESARTSQARKVPRGFIPLRQAAQLPMGTVVEASRGKALVESTATNSSRRTQRAEFTSGRFQMVQKALGGRRSRPVTEMILKGGSRHGCPATRRVRGSGGPAADDSRHGRRRSSRSRVRRLWGRGRGRFRTRGRYSSATVRGTTWLVEDRCGGTLTRLPRRPRNSRVEVRDHVQRRTVTLRAGRSYLAQPRASRRRK